MPFEQILTVGGAVAVGAVALGLFFLNQKRQAGWDQALAEVGSRLGLKVTPVDRYFDLAHGQIGGHSISLSIDSESRGDATWNVMKIEVGFSGDTVTMKAPNQSLGKYQEPDGPRTPCGDPTVDAAVEIYGASPRLLRAIASQSDLRQLIVSLVGQGGVVVHGYEMALRRRQIATKAEEILCVIEPMMTLAQRLERPEAAVTAAPLGTEAARALNLSGLDDERKLHRVRELIDRISPQIGPGQSYLNSNEEEVDWRGTSNGFPLRIKCDTWPDVEMAIKVDHAFGTLDLDCDESKIPQPGTPPVWEDDDQQTVFVGKGVYIQSFAQEVDAELGVFRQLPADLTGPIIAAMRRDDVRYFRIRPGTITVDFWKHLDEMRDPEGQIVRQGQLLGWVAKYLASLQPMPTAHHDTAPPGASAAATKITCAYCQSLYFLVPQTGTGQPYGCPNCGAPPRG